MPGRIIDQDIEEVRQRSDIVEIISGYLQLKRAGRTFKGLCCFHQEKTPSFTVDPSKQLYHCFGCGAGGDVFTFLRQLEGLSFTEAAERLAERTGITLRYEGGTKAGSGTRRQLIEAHAIAADFYESLLQTSHEATAPRRYLEGRGFSPDDAKRWQIGFSPHGKDTLYRHLLQKKIGSKEIVESGLALVGDDGQHRDRFRGRIMFPVRDVSGHVVGFGARAMGDDQPKYLNSPETLIYRKAKILYGLNEAKTEMVRSGRAVVCEGYTDVIGLFKTGINDAVATCGTAIGEDHFALIKRFCDRVILAFDADTAGAIASERGFGIHSKVGIEVLVAPIPAGKDPADLALTEGAEGTQAILDEAVPLTRFVLEAEIARQRIDTPEAKAKAVRAAAAILSTEPNRVARSEHAFWVARRIGVEVDQVLREFSEFSEGRTARAVARPVRLPGHVKVEREALSILMNSPSFLEQTNQWLTTDHFTQPDHRILFEALSGSSPERIVPIMNQLPDDATRRLAAELALAPVLTQDAEEVFLRLEEFRLRRQIDALRAKLDGLDPTADAQEFDAIFKELLKLEELRRRFDEKQE